jgi:hypothetical protein
MRYSLTFIKTIARHVAGFLVALSALYLLLASVGLAPTPSTCITEKRQSLSLLEFNYEISETDCSTLGEDASISVFVSKVGRAEKVLLFKYGPAVVNQMPIITSIDSNTVRISITRISDIIFRRKNWEGLSVDYDIGVVDYPTDTSDK